MGPFNILQFYTHYGLSYKHDVDVRRLGFVRSPPRREGAKMWYSRNLIITFYPLSKAMARWTNKPARECPNVLTYVEVTLSHWMTLRCTSFSNLSAGKPEIATILHLYQTSRSYTSAFSVIRRVNTKVNTALH